MHVAISGVRARHQETGTEYGTSKIIENLVGSLMFDYNDFF